MRKNARVFVTQLPHRRDPESNRLIPAVNIDPASEYGEVTIILPARASIHTMGNEAYEKLDEVLEDYNFERGDAILALGDPALMALAFAIIGRYKNDFCVLCWDRRLGKYLPAYIHMNGE